MARLPFGCIPFADHDPTSYVIAQEQSCPVVANNQVRPSTTQVAEKQDKGKKRDLVNVTKTSPNKRGKGVAEEEPPAESAASIFGGLKFIITMMPRCRKGGRRKTQSSILSLVWEMPFIMG